MPAESTAADPYSVVLADLRAKRDQIDQAIQAIEAVRTSAGFTGPPLPDEPQDKNGAGAFLGMSIAEATKKLLQSQKRAMNNGEIAAALKAGGVVMSPNTDHQNIVGSVLTRRFDKIGDIVRISRGTWGLAEWYPNRNFKKKSQPEDGISLGETPSESDTDDPLA